MYENLSRRAVAAALLSFVAGCSANSTSVGPGQSSSLPTLVREAGPGMRVLPGPAVSGPIIVPLVVHRGNYVRGWPDKKKKKRKSFLFISDLERNIVEIYDPKTPNPSPEGSITDAISTPAGLAVDKKGTLYVANLGNSTITEYPKGMTSPSVTLTTGISGPYGIAVDSKGDVFASNLDTNTVVGFQPGATSPYETIDFSALGQAVGLGTDGKDNVWVACDTDSLVYEIPAGSSTPQNAGLSGLEGTESVQFGPKDVMYVANFTGSNVQVYAYGSTTPSTTITSGIETDGPTLGGFTYSGGYFQSNQDENTVGYKKGQTSPFSTITGNSDPLGVAAIPEVTK